MAIWPGGDKNRQLYCYYKPLEQYIGGSIPNSDIDWGAYYWFEKNGGYQKFCVAQAGLQISKITAELSTSPNFPGNEGWVRVTLTLSGSGSLRILVDGVEAKRDGPFNDGGGLDYTYLLQLTPGTHNICAEAI